MQDNKSVESATKVYEFDWSTDLVDVLSLISSGGKWFWVLSTQDKKLSVSIKGGTLPKNRWWAKKNERQD